MKRLLFTLLVGLVLSGCTILPEKAGIEIMSYPSAKVLIDGKEAGMTPYKNNTIKPGNVEISLVTSEAKWTKKIELPNGVNTVIDREIGKLTDENSGYLLTLESTGDKNKSGIMINSVPDEASVNIDGEVVGKTPLRLSDIGEGEKQVAISIPRHKTITVLVRAIKGYQIVIESDLKEEIPIEVTPVNIGSTIVTENSSGQVIIKATETGWLRVRGQPNSQSAEVSKVNPGTKYPVMAEKDGYYEIDLGEGKSGWISIKYAEKL
jgi:uncharacterized protein YgiM (DUF1202 family)